MYFKPYGIDVTIKIQGRVGLKLRINHGIRRNIRHVTVQNNSCGSRSGHLALILSYYMLMYGLMQQMLPRSSK